MTNTIDEFAPVKAKRAVRKKKDIVLLLDGEEPSNKIALVDMYAMMHFAFHSQIAYLGYTQPEFQKNVDTKSITTHAKFGEYFKGLFKKKIFSILEDNVPKLYKKAYKTHITPHNIVMVYDCKTSDNWRVTRFSTEYKANRGQRLINKFDLEIFDLLHKVVIPEFETRIRTKFGDNSFKLKIINHENAEADDIIGVITQHVKSVPAEKTDILIVTSDSDYAQLNSERVKIYDINFKTKKNPDIYLRECQKLEIDDTPDAPNIILLHKIIKGDKSDEVEGIGKRDTSSESETDSTEGRKNRKKRVNFDAKSLAKDKFKLAQFLNDNDIYRKQFEFNRQLVDMSMIPSDIQHAIIKLWLDTKA